MESDASLNPIRVDHILPPVPQDAVGRARDVREVAEPPHMMFANIAIPPL